MARDADFRSMLDAASRSVGRRRFWWRWLGLCRALGFLVVAWILFARFSGWPTASAPFLAWSAAAALMALLCLPSLRLRERARRSLARRLDEKAAARGSFLASLWLEKAEARPRFAPLVQRAAARAMTGANARPIPLSLRHRAASLCLLAILALLYAIPAESSSAAFAQGRSGSRGDAARGEVEAPRQDGARAPALHELVGLEIATTRKIYLLNEAIVVRVRVVPLGKLDRDLPIALRLGVSNGMPSPDQGLGPSFRVVPDAKPWILPADGSPVERSFRIDPWMVEWGIHDLGIFTLSAMAIARDPARAAGGVLAADRVFQISPNREKQSVARPQPTKKAKSKGKREPKPEKPKEKPKPRRKPTPKKGPGEGGQEPEVKLVPKTVKPLVRKGLEEEREVDVFEREKGVPAHARSKDGDASVKKALQFRRQREERIRRLRLTPGEERLVRRFFGAPDEK